MAARQPKQDADLPPGIFRRGDRYRVIVYAGLDPVTGKQRRITATASTPREAVKEHARLVVEVGKGRHRNGTKLTVAELLERYLRQLQAADRSPSTIDRVRSAADTTINPRIGRLDVAKLDEDALNDLYDDLRAHGRRCQVCWARLRPGLSPLRDGEPYKAWRRPDAIHKGDCVKGQPMAPATVLRIHGILSAALAGAPRKLLDRNPARDAKTPKVRRSQIRPPEHQDVARLLAAAADTDPEWAVWLRLDTMTGGRRGEICAIRIPKIDFATGMVRMDRNIIHARGADGRGELWDVKTKADTAKSPVLDPETLRLVRELVRRKKDQAQRCGTRLARDAYLFSADVEGRHPRRPQLMTKRFERARAKLGLKGVRLHDLRHWAATSMLSAGVPVQTAAGRLGNDPRTMLRVYSHFLPGADRDAGELLAGLVDGPWLPDVDEADDDSDDDGP